MRPHCAVSAAMDLKDWRVDAAPIVGHWVEQPLEVTIGNRTYFSDWTPQGLDGVTLPLTHSGLYLKVKVNGEYEKFHKQLKEDDLQMLVEGERWHVHHRNHNQLDNRLQNIEIMSRPAHLRLHSTEGRVHRKRDWAAPRTKFRRQ